VAGRVDLRDIGDLRRLAQQLEELDATQLDVACIELRQSSVGELLLDALDVLLDARGRRERLFVLQRRERSLGFLVSEVEADAAGREQRDRHQRQDQQQVLPEQPPAARAADRCGAGAAEKDRCHS
jgi:hypothetical protein